LDIGGLWTAKFSTALGTGSGVVCFVDGQIFGGDSNYYYSGSYRSAGDGKAITGIFRVVHFFGPLNNVFGPLREISLSFAGAVGTDLIMGNARTSAMPSLTLAIRLDRVDPRAA
jgi:hypothetical protein